MGLALNTLIEHAEAAGLALGVNLHNPRLAALAGGSMDEHCSTVKTDIDLGKNKCDVDLI